MSGSPILLLGASGFIGTHVRSAIVASGIVGWTSISRTHVVPGSTLPGERWRVLDGDPPTNADLEALLTTERPAVVINSAGVTTGSATAQVSANIVLTARLLETMARLPHPSRLVQIGSAAEYGPTPPSVPISETTACQPTSLYGITKLAATQLVVDARRQGVVQGTVLRLFNPVGARMSDRSLPGRATLLLHHAVRSGNRQIRLGSLDSWRDYIDVRETARVIVAAALLSEAPRAGIVNVGAGRALLTRDVVRELCRIAGFEGTITEDAVASERSNAVPWQAADTDLARDVFGWSPYSSIDDALQALWAGTG